jgi:pimeloyl-ACP methyl ester carboxylesterase
VHVAKLLRQYGHEVYCPTLTGLGDRSHLLSKNISLKTHIEDVQQLLQFEDLTDVVLVGHSYAGMIITGVDASVANRIGCLVYFDAVIPENGQSHNDVVPQARELFASVKEFGLGWLIPPWSAATLGITDPDDAKWVADRLTPHPWATWEQPLCFNSTEAHTIPRHFIRCTGFSLESMELKAQSKGWHCHRLATGHDAMITVPTEVAALLLECASGASAEKSMSTGRGDL